MFYKFASLFLEEKKTLKFKTVKRFLDYIGVQSVHCQFHTLVCFLSHQDSSRTLYLHCQVGPLYPGVAEKSSSSHMLLIVDLPEVVLGCEKKQYSHPVILYNRGGEVIFI